MPPPKKNSRKCKTNYNDFSVSMTKISNKLKKGRFIWVMVSGVHHGREDLANQFMTWGFRKQRRGKACDLPIFSFPRYFLWIPSPWRSTSWGMSPPYLGSLLQKCSQTDQRGLEQCPWGLEMQLVGADDWPSHQSYLK